MTRLEARIDVARGGFRLDVDLVIEPGQIVAVLGPNGSGKSTLLAALAGLLPIGSGAIRLGEHVFDDPATRTFQRPERRPVGVVFQDYRLFPRQTALENVAFGPRARGVKRSVARQRAQRWLTELGVGELARRRPKALSGGQAQRVALARALASEPALLLLDEPLAALDVQSRRDVQDSLRSHLEQFTGPVLIVTHDPVDAVVLADRLIVIEGGRIVQDASPEDVSTRPASAYVARLLDLNLYRGSVAANRMTIGTGGTLLTAGIADAEEALAVLRPAAVTVHLDEPADLSARNVWPGRIQTITRLPDRVRIRVDAEPATIVDLTAGATAELDLRPGRAVWLSAKATDIHSYVPQ